MDAKPIVLFLTGAGLSVESGLPTFRGSGGLWENHRIEEVASPHAWEADRELVLRFYNERRRALRDARPNRAHLLIAELETDFDVRVVTQNIDDLHERAGSSAVLHLHGELTKARSVANPGEIVDIGYRDISVGDLAADGAQLRPHVVWFGEEVPMLATASAEVAAADAIVVVGTSLQVYPAASLIWDARPDALCILIDPHPPEVPGFHIIRAAASAGLEEAIPLLKNKLLRADGMARS